MIFVNYKYFHAINKLCNSVVAIIMTLDAWPKALRNAKWLGNPP